MEYISGFPEFLQNVQQIQDQGDAERPSTRICKARSPSVSATRVLMPCGSRRLHLMCDLLDDGGLAFEQTGPHPLVLWTRSGRLVGRNLAYTEQAFHNLFWGAHPGRPGEHRGHSFAVGFLALGESHGGWCASAVRDF